MCSRLGTQRMRVLFGAHVLGDRRVTMHLRRAPEASGAMYRRRCGTRLRTATRESPCPPGRGAFPFWMLPMPFQPRSTYVRVRVRIRASLYGMTRCSSGGHVGEFRSRVHGHNDRPHTPSGCRCLCVRYNRWINGSRGPGRGARHAAEPSRQPRAGTATRLGLDRSDDSALATPARRGRENYPNTTHMKN